MYSVKVKGLQFNPPAHTHTKLKSQINPTVSIRYYKLRGLLPGTCLVPLFGVNLTDVWPKGLLFIPVTRLRLSKALRGSL